MAEKKKETKEKKEKKPAAKKAPEKTPAKKKAVTSHKPASKKVHAKSKPIKTATKAESAVAKYECRIAKCVRPYRAKGYCRVHYKKWRQGEYGKTRYKACTEEMCQKPQGLNRHGYCDEHYQGFYVKGSSATETPATQALATEALAPDATEEKGAA